MTNSIDDILNEFAADCKKASEQFEADLHTLDKLLISDEEIAKIFDISE